MQFREWVQVRKTDYNLAPSKVEKARVAQEVIALVRGQDPPGRFLQKDSSGGVGNWWVELDEDRVVAKTSQALREGAPSIRAAHQKEINEIKTKVGRKHAHAHAAAARKIAKISPVTSPATPLKRNSEVVAATWPAPVPSENKYSEDAAYQERAMMELRTNVEQARLRNDLLENDPVIRAEKRLRLDEEGNAAPLALAPPPPMPFISTVPRQGFGNEQRQNSLALSEFSFDAGMDDFVNPFADETEDNDSSKAADKPPRSISISTFSIPSTPRPGGMLSHENSMLSLGDNSGFKSLTNNTPLPTATTPAVPLQEPLNNRNKSGQSVATQISKLDWDDSDPLLQYLTSVAAQ